METIEFSDIQGIVLRGYGKFPISQFLLLQVADAELARRWLGEIGGVIHSSAKGGQYDKKDLPEPVCNVAFTFEGLQALGLSASKMKGFLAEFREGMVTPHRQRLLGDFAESDPEKWRWGGPNNEALHVMLFLYATDEPSMTSFSKLQVEELSAKGLKLIEKLEGLTLPDRKEHFGFRDGIGQPSVRDCDDGGPESNQIAIGEFVLGYKNQYGLYPDSPVVFDSQGNTDHLETDAAGSGGKDFGRNGSYLVFRQLSQDVRGFWTFVSDKAGSHGGPNLGSTMIWLASKMVGRWPSGAPVTVFPDGDPGGVSDEDDFGYRENDAHGIHCPIGSHVRRTNPRDSLQDGKAAQSTKIANHHRIIRRGRAYGKPSAESMNPIDMLKAPAARDEVGLHFICFNANIANQFQFIQFNWANSPKFERFYNDPDPLIGVRTDERGESQTFTIPADPVRKSVTGLKRFVEVRGGAYLFMPGIRAIRYLASIGGT